MVEDWARETFWIEPNNEADDIVPCYPLRQLPALVFLQKTLEGLFLTSHWRVDAIGYCLLLNRLFTLLGRAPMSLHNGEARLAQDLAQPGRRICITCAGDTGYREYSGAMNSEFLREEQEPDWSAIQTRPDDTTQPWTLRVHRIHPRELRGSLQGLQGTQAERHGRYFRQPRRGRTQTPVQRACQRLLRIGGI